MGDVGSGDRQGRQEPVSTPGRVLRGVQCLLVAVGAVLGGCGPERPEFSKERPSPTSSATSDGVVPASATQVSPTQVSPTQVSPTQVSPTQVSPAALASGPPPPDQSSGAPAETAAVDPNLSPPEPSLPPSSGCDAGNCGGPAECGNSLIEAAEECDPPNGLSCSAKCTTIVCGNGILEGAEDCDDGNANNTDACSAQCKFPSCGNGVIEGAEACDDGNRLDVDDCTNACSRPNCGDERVDGDEDCDPPDNVLCSAACRAIVCGDGVAEAAEQCDDGNADDRDACTSDCDFTCPSGGVPAANDRCDVAEDDANCNGTPNDACECVGAERITCGELHAAKGDCAATSLGCLASGTWPTVSSCASTVEEKCNNDGRDEDCDGQVNEDCDCLLGETASCEQLYDSLGDCAARLLGCTANGTWPPASSCAPTAGQNCSAPTPGAGGSANTGGGAGGAP